MKKLYLIATDFSAQMKKLNMNAYASSMAFFILLSLVPMLIALCTILPYTPLTEENLITLVTDFTPDTMDNVARNLIHEVYSASAGVLSVAIVTTIWSSAKGVMALMRGLNVVNEVEESRGGILVHMIACVYTVLMLIVVILSLFGMVFGNQLVDLLLYRFPRIRLLVSFIMEFRFLAVWVVLTLLFAVIYAYVPDRKLKFREQIPGACFAAVSWSVFSWAFSIYVNRSGAFTVYGSMSIIVIVMLWLYACMYITLIGAYLNRYFRPVNRVLVGTKK